MKKVAIFLLGIVLVACNKQSQESNIISVQMVRSGAWSDYGAAIKIDSAMNYIYYSRNLKQGYFGGKIDRKFWDTLNQKFETLKFRTLKTDPYATTARDGQYYELTITWKDGKTSVKHTANYLKTTDPIKKTFIWLNNSFKKVRLHRLKFPIKFETKFEDIPPLPADSAAFLPPLLDK